MQCVFLSVGMKSEGTSRSDAVSRRSVLRTMAAGALTTSAVASTSASATTVRRERMAGHSDLIQSYSNDDPSAVSTDVDDRIHVELLATYADQETVEDELRSAAGPILSKLVEHGYLDAPTLEAFDLNDVHHDSRVLEPGADDGGVSVTSIQHGDETSAHLMAATTVNGHDIGLYHQPEAGNTLAKVVDADETLVFYDTSENGDVGMDGECSLSSYCSSDVCCTCWFEHGKAEYYWLKEEECCVQADGSTTCDSFTASCPCEDTPCC